MSSAPSHQPEVKKLSNELLKCHKAFENGMAAKHAFGASMTKELLSMGAAGLDVHDSLSRHGDTIINRLAGVMITQGILMPRTGNESRPVNYGTIGNWGMHPLIQGILETQDDSWFTITRAQELAINEYLHFPPNMTAGQYFIVRDDTPPPAPPPGTQPSSRELTPFEMLGNNQAFHGRLRDVQWADLHALPRVLPGNLVPGEFLNLPTVSGGMNLEAGTVPTSMLGEACAMEAEQVTRRNEQGLLRLRNLNEQRDALPPHLERLNKKDLIKLIHQQRGQVRNTATAIDEMMANARQSDRRRAQRWRNLFVQVGTEQAQNRRPGLWSPAEHNARDELQALEPAVQRIIPPASIPRAAPPIPVLAPSAAAQGWNAPSHSRNPSGSRNQLPASQSQSRLPRSSSRSQLPASSSRPQLPASSSRGSLLQHEVRQDPTDWEQSDPITPQPRRLQAVGPRRNLGDPIGQALPAYLADYEDDEEEAEWDIPTFSQERRDRPSSRRKRESQGGGSAYGRASKSPTKEDPRSPWGQPRKH